MTGCPTPLLPRSASLVNPRCTGRPGRGCSGPGAGV